MRSVWMGLIGVPAMCIFISRPLPSAEEKPLLPTSIELPAAGRIPRTVKVALLEKAAEVSVLLRGRYEMFGEEGSEITVRGSGPRQIKVSVQDGALEVDGDRFYVDRLDVRSDGVPIRVGNRDYPDGIRILKNPDGTVTVVNEVGLETYLKGVLPLEVSPEWPIESLKAQAVASRTFALFKALEKQDQQFSLRDTTASQVYGGSLFHKEATDSAVEDTKGEILTYGGKIFPAYFFANCGGRTAQADLIWGVEPNPVLSSVECEYCKGTKHYEWSLEMPLEEVREAMRANGYPASDLRRVRFGDYDPSGRALSVTLTYARSEVTIRADDFRAFLGPDRLRSLKAAVEVRGSTARFKGRGWGHGIGFCQWGAKGQAEAGRDYKTILQFYYPASEIKSIDRTQETHD